MLDNLMGKLNFQSAEVVKAKNEKVNKQLQSTLFNRVSQAGELSTLIDNFDIKDKSEFKFDINF